MLKPFLASEFGVYATNFERACAATQIALEPFRSEAERKSLTYRAIAEWRASLEGMIRLCVDADVPISSSVASAMERFHGRLKEWRADDPDDFDYKAAMEIGLVIRQLLHDELFQHMFVFIPEKDRELYEQREPPFGDDVAEAFGEAKQDIAAAARCLALQEPNATVFHLMRVLECGLGRLASRFNVPFETDSWHTVIRAIEDQIKLLREKPNKAKTAQDREEITALSQVATEFRHFKDAWRNHAMHAKEFYTEREALNIYEHVKAFIQMMSAPVVLEPDDDESPSS